MTEDNYEWLKDRERLVRMLTKSTEILARYGLFGLYDREDWIQKLLELTNDGGKDA